MGTGLTFDEYVDLRLRPLREAAERESQKYDRRELPGLTIFTLRQGEV